MIRDEFILLSIALAACCCLAIWLYVRFANLRRETESERRRAAIRELLPGRNTKELLAALDELAKKRADAIDYRAVLDAISVPVWLRGQDLALRWANRAYLEAVAGDRNEQARNANLQNSEAALAEVARDRAGNAAAKRSAIVAGKRREFLIDQTSLPGYGVAGVAVDVTDASAAEAQLQRHIEASADMMEGMPMAVAIFAKDHRIASYNRNFAKMWRLPGEWLDTRPTLSDFLDRLRETRQLPEQNDFAAWKQSQLRWFSAYDDPEEEFWHRPDGRSLRVVARPHLLGGMFYIFEDISEQIRLEASFRLLNQVQRAALDLMDDGIAIFGPDGRLLLHNRTFAKLWHLGEDELSGNPHYVKVANLAERRMGQDGIWSIISAGLTASEPERCSEWGKVTRADGRILSLAMARMPNGATAVTIADLTDLERFETFKREHPDAAA